MSLFSKVFAAIILSALSKVNLRVQQKVIKNKLEAFKESIRITKGWLQRSLKIWSFFFSFAIQYVLLLRFQKKTEVKYNQNLLKLAKFLSDKISELGPTFMKLRQILYETRPERLHSDLIKHVSLLQDQIPNLSGDDVVKIIEKEFQQPIHQMFESFNRTAIASSTLAQIHAATLKHPKVKVAVKVQRQGLRELFNIDLKNIKLLAIILDKFDRTQILGQQPNWLSIYNLLSTSLYEEIDYQTEGLNLMRMKENIKNNIPWKMKLPNVFPNLTSNHVLTIEYTTYPQYWNFIFPPKLPLSTSTSITVAATRPTTATMASYLCSYTSATTLSQVYSNESRAQDVTTKEQDKNGTVYVLQCEEDKYYVGLTIDLNTRLQKHLSGRGFGAEWTRRYQPIGLAETFQFCDTTDETAITLKYMRQYGHENVRGGAFVCETLPSDLDSFLYRVSCHEEGRCFVCGGMGHFAKQCRVNTRSEDAANVTFDFPVPTNSPLVVVASQDVAEGRCFKCGEKGHFARDCFRLNLQVKKEKRIQQLPMTYRRNLKQTQTPRWESAIKDPSDSQRAPLISSLLVLNETNSPLTKSSLKASFTSSKRRRTTVPSSNRKDDVEKRGNRKRQRFQA